VGGTGGSNGLLFVRSKFDDLFVPGRMLSCLFSRPMSYFLVTVLSVVLMFPPPTSWGPPPTIDARAAAEPNGGGLFHVLYLLNLTFFDVPCIFFFFLVDLLISVSFL